MGRGQGTGSTVETTRSGSKDPFSSVMGGTRGIEAIDPLDLREWEGAGIHAKMAQKWMKAGFELEKAVELTEAGFQPEEPGEWVDHGFALGGAMKLKSSGMGVKEGKEWLEAGFTPDETIDLTEAGMEGTRDALAWKISGLNLADARDIKQSIDGCGDGDKELDNHADAFDSRDVLARILRLAEEKVDAEQDGEELDDESASELKKLQGLERQAREQSDWQYGTTLVRDSYFLDYAQETAHDGPVDKVAVWPNNHIDWEAASEELKMDYGAVDFDGVTYWVRN